MTTLLVAGYIIYKEIISLDIPMLSFSYENIAILHRPHSKCVHDIPTFKTT